MLLKKFLLVNIRKVHFLCGLFQLLDFKPDCIITHIKVSASNAGFGIRMKVFTELFRC